MTANALSNNPHTHRRLASEVLSLRYNTSDMASVDTWSQIAHHFTTRSLDLSPENVRWQLTPHPQEQRVTLYVLAAFSAFVAVREAQRKLYRPGMTLTLCCATDHLLGAARKCR